MPRNATFVDILVATVMRVQHVMTRSPEIGAGIRSDVSMQILDLCDEFKGRMTTGDADTNVPELRNSHHSTTRPCAQQFLCSALIDTPLCRALGDTLLISLLSDQRQMMAL